MIFCDQFPGSCGRGKTSAENLGFLQFGFSGGEGEIEVTLALEGREIARAAETRGNCRRKKG